MSFKLNGIPVNVTRFPDQTSQIWKVEERALNYIIPEIEWDFDNEGEIVQLAQLVDLLRNIPKPVSSIRLLINYLPFARQDKPISNETTFALHSFARLLNSLQIEDIKILDPHSSKATELIKNSRGIKPLHFIKNVIKIVNPDVLVFPDAGAYSKYKAVNFGIDKIYAEKTRNPLTGELSGCKVNGDVKDQSVLIVDDLADAGGTFIQLSKELHLNGSKEVNLYVTHGLFTKGLIPLRIDGKINRIFTKNGEALTWNHNEICYKTWENLK